MCYNHYMIKGRFKFIYQTKQKAPLMVMLALFVLTSVINVFKLTEVLGFVSYDFWIDIIGCLFSALMIGFICSILFLSKYELNDKALTEYIGIFKKKIPCESISQIVSLKEGNGLFVLYTESPDALTYRKINIYSQKADAFVACVRSVNPRIVYSRLSEEELK